MKTLTTLSLLFLAASLHGQIKINGGGGGSISTLSDTTIASPASDEVLKYDGSAWVNGVVAASATNAQPPSTTLTNLSNTGAITNLANVILTHSADGTITLDTASADTDAARGQALTNALDAASSGDIVTVGPGTYAFAAGFYYIVTNKTLTVTGAGKGRTRITADVASQGVIFNKNSGNLSLNSLTLTNENALGIGFKNDEHLELRNVRSSGLADGAGIIVNTASRGDDTGATLDAWDSELWTGWDGIIVASTNAVVNLHNCLIKGYAVSLTDNNGIGVTGPGAVANLYGGVIDLTFTNGVTGQTAGTASGTATLNSYGVAVRMDTGGATSTSDYAQSGSGTINVFGGSHDPENTTGTITYENLNANNFVAAGNITSGGQTLYITSDQEVSIKAGTGSPEGVVSAFLGSLWMNTNGGAQTTFYRKESGGNGNTGWVADSAGGGTSSGTNANGTMLIDIDDAVSIALPAQGVYTNITSFSESISTGITEGLVDGVFTNTTAGYYFMLANIGFDSAAAQEFQFSFATNTSAATFGNYTTNDTKYSTIRKIGTGGDIGNVGISGVAWLPASSVIQVIGRNLDATTALRVSNMTFTVMNVMSGTNSSGIAGPGGSTTELQFNNGGTLDGTSGITVAGETNLYVTGSNNVNFLTVTNGIQSGSTDAGSLQLNEGSGGANFFKIVADASITVDSEAHAGDNGLSYTNDITLNNLKALQQVQLLSSGSTVHLAAATTNNVTTTNYLGVTHMAAAATLIIDGNSHSKEIYVTNRISAATTIRFTNTWPGQEFSLNVLGEASGGTSRVITMIPHVAANANFVADLDAFGTAIAANKAVTLTNGNALEISWKPVNMLGTNIAAVVTRQYAF